MAQTCCNRLQITAPVSSFPTSTDNNFILLKALMNEAAQSIRDEYSWPELQREYTFDLATSTESYILPGDYDRTLSETWWNRTQRWPLIGPMTPQDWQLYKSGLITQIPRQRFRVKYWATKQFFIDPTPTSSENGQTCVYEYITRTVFRPKTWVASTSWTGLSYCSYNGNIYTRGSEAAATTGTIAPVNTSGSQSDGSITWTYVDTAYDTIVYDSDECILDNDMIIDQTVWRFKQERGLDYEDLRQQAKESKEVTKTKLSGSGVVSMNSRIGYPPILSINNYPEGKF